MEVLTKEMIVLRAKASDKEDAIRQAGDALVRAGCALPLYVDGMLAREQMTSTYIDAGIAIPHGRLIDLALVKRPGVSVIQIPEGVDWASGQRAYLVIGLASTDLAHAGIMSNLVDLLQAPEEIQTLVLTADPAVIVERLTRGRSE